MLSKILAKQTLLIVILTGLMLSPVLVFASPSIFTRNLRAGMRGEDVRELQKFLNTDVKTQVATAGFGSAGNETNYFGPATKRAVIKFQEKYRVEVLVPIGLISGTGILGVKTREKINMFSEAARSVITPQSQQEQAIFVPVGRPVRLKIPGINVDAAVEFVGLTSDGAMGVPKDSADVAWFNLGQRPGENGSAVIAGHYGWKNRKASAFDNLYKLRPGDKIYIEDDKGMTITFVVRLSRRYDSNADAPEVFSSNDGKSHLNLVTCEGIWDKASKSYSKRLVVFTDKE